MWISCFAKRLRDEGKEFEDFCRRLTLKIESRQRDSQEAHTGQEENLVPWKELCRWRDKNTRLDADARQTPLMPPYQCSTRTSLFNLRRALLVAFCPMSFFYILFLSFTIFILAGFVLFSALANTLPFAPPSSANILLLHFGLFPAKNSQHISLSQCFAIGTIPIFPRGLQIMKYSPYSTKAVKQSLCSLHHGKMSQSDSEKYCQIWQ